MPNTRVLGDCRRALLSSKDLLTHPESECAQYTSDHTQHEGAERESRRGQPEARQHQAVLDHAQYMGIGLSSGNALSKGKVLPLAYYPRASFPFAFPVRAAMRAKGYKVLLLADDGLVISSSRVGLR